MSVKLSGNQIFLLRWLAENGPTTEYALAKETGLNRYTAHNIPRVLYKKGLVRFKSGGISRAGREIKLYHPTFHGFIVYFSSHRCPGDKFFELKEHYESVRSSLERAIKVASEIYPEEKIFTEWPYLEKYFGILGYAHLCEAAYLVEKRPPAFPLGYKAEDMFSTIMKENELTLEQRHIAERSGIALKEDYIWRLTFEQAFVGQFVGQPISNRIMAEYMKGELKPIPNEELRNLFTEVIGSMKAEARYLLKELNKMEKAFSALFGKRPMKGLET